MTTDPTETLLDMLDTLDARGGAGLKRAKAYSIEAMQKEGYTAEQIAQTLGLPKPGKR
ncbi:MAG: hypothetical protein K2Q01_05335 [Rickettsiales bacterium]|nr:hypothetical protein [Rickettsiales bacterium]